MKIKIGETEFETPFRTKNIQKYSGDIQQMSSPHKEVGYWMDNYIIVDAKGVRVLLESTTAQTIAAALNAYFEPVDAILFCPKCNFQHVDEAEPDNCKNCGHEKDLHLSVVDGVPAEYFGRCDCCDNPKEGFTAWENPPHKKYRCKNCNYVWKPANTPTNDVAALEEGK